LSFFLFPGQGSQAPGMGRDFYAHSTAAREVFEAAAALSPSGFLDTIFCGGEETLAQTRLAQPALLTVSIAIVRHLKTYGIRPAGCAGHSLGEFSALVAAEALTFEDGLRLVHERARCMSEYAGAGTMAAVIGLSPSDIERALPEGAEVANYNGPQQTIISGTYEAIEAAETALKDAGARRIIRLAVSGPFHSNGMREAAAQFNQALDGAVIAPPQTPFVSSVTASELAEPEAIRSALSEQICAPVRWTETLQCIGPVPALEVGPGKVLQGIAKRTESAPEVQPAGTLDACAVLDAA
jgi:[acyl-carrier-protein] S-malonyltransferase